jgi:hypothetical protein
LAPQPSVGLDLLLKIRPNFLEASQQFSFLQGRVVSPTPNPIPEDQASVFYIPQRQGDYPFQSPLTTRMGYGGTILIPRSPHEDPLCLRSPNSPSTLFSDALNYILFLRLETKFYTHRKQHVQSSIIL